MKTKSRFFKVTIPVLFLLSLILFSCKKEDHTYSVGDFAFSFGIVEKRSNTPNDFLIHLDDGNNLVPAGTSVDWTQIKDNQRVWVYFNPLGDQKLTDSTVTYIGNIVDLKDILFKDIKKYTVVADDSMGHDPLNIKDAWISRSLGIITFELLYYTQGSIHYINLIDNGEGNGINNPFVLELRHNARGDRKDFPASAYVSFRLDYLKLTGKTETKFIVRCTGYDGRHVDMPLTFSYK